jgi:hypothetical protein
MVLFPSIIFKEKAGGTRNAKAWEITDLVYWGYEYLDYCVNSLGTEGVYTIFQLISAMAQISIQ